MDYQAIHPSEKAPEQSVLPQPQLEVVVLFTDVPSTISAVRTAAQLAQGITVRIRLLLLQQVPYPLPLNEPSVGLQFIERRFQSIVDTCQPNDEVRPVVIASNVCLCRDSWSGLNACLLPHSVIVIGKRSRWWFWPEDRLARKLRAAGHHVVRASVQRKSADA